MDYKHICQIILNVTLISVFIGIFFFTYGKSVEEDIITDQSEYIASDIASELNIFLTDDVKTELKNSLNAPSMEEEDKKANDSNKDLVKKSAIILSILFAVGITIVFVTVRWAKVNENILLESFIILCFVAFTEFLFLNLIARNFRIADDNFVKKQMIVSIKKSVQ